MRRLRKPSVLNWLVCVGVFAGGAALLGLHLTSRTRSSTPEKELIVAEAIASSVSEHMFRGNHYLKFTVGRYAIEYDGAQPHYDDLRSAVQSGRPVRVWVSARNEAPIPIGKTVTLYKLQLGDTLLLSYAETAAYRAKQEYAVPIVGGVLAAMGAFFTLGCAFTHRRYAGPVGNRFAATLRDRRRPAMCARM
jgi:hypothetical protein